MKRLMTVSILALVVSAAAAAHAQAPATPGPRHQHEGGAPPAAPGPGHGGMMPMEMCRQMMGGGHMMGGHMMGGGGPMAGMHGMHATDPKTMSEMMEFRGEMMKAMGEVMIKHARRLGASPRP